MTENLKNPTQKQVFDYVKSLCIQKKHSEARNLIIHCAGINTDEAKSVKGRMSDYVRQKTDNPIIHDMLKIEKAYFDLHLLFKDEAEQKQEAAIVVVAELEEILPLLNKEEKAFTHYYLGYCQEIANPEDDTFRANHLKQVIKLTDEGTNDSRLYSCALDIDYLSIPAEDKYNNINLAFKKTKVKSVYGKNYKAMLAKAADKYYWELSGKMDDSSLEYNIRNKAGKKAFGLIDVLSMPELKKCAYKIKLLNNLENLQRNGGDEFLAEQTAIKKQNVIFKSARIRKSQIGSYSRKWEYD